MQELITECVCGSSAFKEPREMNDIVIKECLDCGVKHQEVHFTEAQYYAWYETEYDTKHQHLARLEHDRDIARLRMTHYEGKIPTSGTTLDIGCGNGAFVDVALDHGYDAYGNELCPDVINDRTYPGMLMDNAFPDEHFSLITLHDVLEHLPNPNQYLREIHRILDKEGVVIIDLPHYWVPEGRHHWKPVEHLWYWTADQLVKTLGRCDFAIDDITIPIPSKITFFVAKK